MSNVQVKPVVILPADGMADPQAVVNFYKGFFSSSPYAALLVEYAKLNDALHFPYMGPAILGELRPVLPEHVGLFVDLKIADVSATDQNTLLRYKEFNPGIVTVSSSVTAKALVVIRETLPDVKIALVDTLTDMSEAECKARYHGQSPLEKIRHALTKLEGMLGDKNPINMVICSPRETSALKAEFPRYLYGNPGIRSPHMNDDHQKRTTSAYDALANGADYVVMGTQLTKGNPERGISAEQSQQITFEEIKRYFLEKVA